MKTWAPGCSCCVTVTGPKVTVSAFACRGTPLPLVGATVKAIRSGFPDVVCTTGADGKCVFTLPAATYTIAMTSPTYNAQTFVNVGTSDVSNTFSHPKCSGPWASPLHLSTPWGAVALAKDTTSSTFFRWTGSLTARCPATVLDLVAKYTYNGGPGDPCNGTYNDCPGSPTSLADVLISYLLNCTPPTTTSDGSFILQATYTACGKNASTTCAFNRISATPMSQYYSTGALVAVSTMNQFSHMETINSPPLAVCGFNISEPPNLVFPMDYTALGSGPFDSLLTQ